MILRRRNLTDAVAPGRPKAQGFTLIELILSLILMTAMVAITWNLMGAFKTQLESGAKQSEDWQLVRSVQQSLKRDLQTVRKPKQNRERDEQASESSEASTTSAEATNETGTPNASSSVAPPSLRPIGSGNRTDATPTANTSSAGDFSYTLEQQSTSSSNTDSATDSSIPSAVDLFVDAKQITHQAWRADDVLFYGTSQALLFDAARPAEVGERPRPGREPDLNNAALPDDLRRYIYVFTDPESALLSDRPRGLLRIQLNRWQRLKLSSMTGDQLDLVDLLKPLLPLPDELPQELQPAGFDSNVTGSRSFGANATSNLVASSGSRSGSQPLLGQDPNQPTSAFYGSDQHKQLNLGAHLDYLPEVSVLAFRYFDGDSWSTFWDGREQGLPVAVEVRFQLESEVRKRLQAARDLTGEDSSLDTPETDRFGVSLSTSETTMQPTMPTEDALSTSASSLSSTLEEPPEDHRFLIYLQPPPEREEDEIDAQYDSPSSSFGARLRERLEAN